MPIYEYKCASCGVTLEKLQKISDPKLIDCPECGKSTLEKQVTASGFRLKGSGWYETDFKTGSKKNLAGGADKKPSSSSSTDSAQASKKDDSKKAS